MSLLVLNFEKNGGNEVAKGKKKAAKKNNTGTYFFAYQSVEKSGSCDNVDAIQSVAKYLGSKAITWEKMKINGKLINRKILEEIEKAETFACDLTYLNPNVYFELGYAIGKRKPLFIMLNTNVKGAAQNYANINILKGIGYTTFKNADDLKQKIVSDVDKESILLDQLKNFLEVKSGSIDIFYIKSSANSQAEMDTIDYIKNSQLSQICDDRSEIAYEPLEWYLESLSKCRNLIVHLSSNDKNTAVIDNAKNSLYSGLGYALGKRVLLVAPKPYFAPMDYSDILLEYSSAQDCVDQIKTWLNKSKRKVDRIEDEPDKELNLLKLGIGYSIAEDEKDALLNYFVETHSYRMALKSRCSIFYGRKGTGKTALYIKLFDDFSHQKNTYLIGLKPESTELIDNIQAIRLYEDTASKKSLFHSIWKYVLYSKLVLEIYYKISKKTRIEYSETEDTIINFYNNKRELLQPNFFGTLKLISDECQKRNWLATKVVEEYNRTILVPMLDMIKEYFKDTKYYKLAILADNLDKAWDADADLSLQSEMILSLLEVSGKLQQELYGKDNEKIETTVIMFLRLDIYKFVLSDSREPDKLTVGSHEVEWASCKELLKSLVEKRIIHVLEMKPQDSIDSIWKDYFDFVRDDPIEMVQNACLPRPRDILLFFGKMFESACNNSRSRVNKQDYEYALNNYTNFLYQNLIAEMSAEYPYIRKMIGELHSRFTDKMEINRFRQLVNNYESDEIKANQLISDLFSNEYLVATDKEHNERYMKYEDVQMVENDVKHTRYLPFKRKYLYIMQHPRYARMKL